MSKISFIDITFHANSEYADTDALIKAQYSSLNYINAIKDKLDIEVIKHIDNRNTIIREYPNIRFFRGRNRFLYIPLTTLQYLKKKQPDIVLVQGLKFPFQLIMLKWFLGKNVKCIVNHHADHPPAWPKKIIQQIADRYTDKYLFTSLGNAREWLNTKMIGHENKIVEFPSTFTAFTKKHKISCRQKLQMGEGLHYLWVGRLNGNKDPITVLSGFEKFLHVYADACLHFIYQSTDLLSEMKSFVEEHPLLRNSVKLHGYVPYEELPIWYSAADFFVSASHYEGGNTGLQEAMACGCIPIVSAIPPAMKVICDGAYGFYFEPGNAEALVNIFISSSKNNIEELSLKVENHFQKEYSLAAVSEKLFQLCRGLSGK